MADEARIRVLIVDDDPIVCAALTGFVAQASDIDLVGQAANGQAALDIVSGCAVDVALMDLHMPVMDGIVATRQIVRDHPEVKVLVLTSSVEDEKLRESFHAGASGYLLKATTQVSLVDAIRGVHAGETVISPSPTALATASADAVCPSAKAPELFLTPREKAILVRLCQGASNAEIAQEEFLSESTVKSYVSTIIAKLGVTSRLKAVVRAFEWNLLD